MRNIKSDWGGYKSDLDNNEKLMVAIVKASETYKKKSGAIFRNYGLTFSQYNVLRILNSSPKGKNTITITSRILLVSGANMTGIAKRMEKDGLIIKRSDHNDDRVTLLEITPKGRQIIKYISEKKDKLIEMFLKEFSKDEKLTMLEHLKRIFNERYHILSDL